MTAEMVAKTKLRGADSTAPRAAFIALLHQVDCGVMSTARLCDVNILTSIQAAPDGIDTGGGRRGGGIVKRKNPTL